MRNWKDAATLLLAAKIPTTEHGFNYKLLMMKRSSKSKFMANAVVFPGGICDKADFSSIWEKLLLKNAKQANKLLAEMPRPPMFRIPEYEGINPELGYRISAIRETFEESGIPLFKTCHSGTLDPDQGPNEVIKRFGPRVLSEWRKKVDDDGSNLFRMCSELQLVPDIWSLKTWSNWLTPTHMQSLHGKSPRRYDTIFYMCCLPYTPEHLHDDRELVSSEWSAPTENLRRNYEEKIWLAPPQIYELSRLCGIRDFDELLNYSTQRESAGCERWFPVKFMCKDGVITTLPGDSLHPDNPDLIGDDEEPEIQQTMSESRLSTERLHRVEFISRHDVNVHCSFDLPHQQISTVPGQKFKESLTERDKHL